MLYDDGMDDTASGHTTYFVSLPQQQTAQSQMHVLAQRSTTAQQQPRSSSSSFHHTDDVYRGAPQRAFPGNRPYLGQPSGPTTTTTSMLIPGEAPIERQLAGNWSQRHSGPVVVRRRTQYYTTTTGDVDNGLTYVIDDSGNHDVGMPNDVEFHPSFHVRGPQMSPFSTQQRNEPQQRPLWSHVAGNEAHHSTLQQPSQQYPVRDGRHAGHFDRMETNYSRVQPVQPVSTPKSMPRAQQRQQETTPAKRRRPRSRSPLAVSSPLPPPNRGNSSSHNNQKKNNNTRRTARGTQSRSSSQRRGAKARSRSRSRTRGSSSSRRALSLSRSAARSLSRSSAARSRRPRKNSGGRPHSTSRSTRSSSLSPSPSSARPKAADVVASSSTTRSQRSVSYQRQSVVARAPPPPVSNAVQHGVESDTKELIHTGSVTGSVIAMSDTTTDSVVCQPSPGCQESDSASTNFGVSDSTSPVVSASTTTQAVTQGAIESQLVHAVPPPRPDANADSDGTSLSRPPTGPCAEGTPTTFGVEERPPTQQQRSSSVVVDKSHSDSPGAADDTHTSSLLTSFSSREIHAALTVMAQQQSKREKCVPLPSGHKAVAAVPLAGKEVRGLLLALEMIAAEELTVSAKRRTVELQIQEWLRRPNTQ